MALRLVFNPISGKFDYVDTIDTSAFAPAMPHIIAAGNVLSVPTNVQMSFTEPPIIEAGASILLNGTASLTGLK